MELFSWANIVFNSMVLTWENFWIPVLVGVACFLLVYIFRAVALFTIAKREGFPHKWMAFVPFFSTYYIGVVSQMNRVYNAKATTISLIAAIVEAVSFVLYVLYYAVVATIVRNGFYTITTSVDYGITRMVVSLDSVALADHGLSWMGWIYTYGSYVLNYVLDLAWFVLSLLIYIAFFQTYATGHYYLFAVTSAFFPISGLLFFVVRNNHPKNYRAYIRAQQEQAYRMRQQYYNNQYNQNPYNQNPYNQNPYNQNPYNQNPNGNNNSAPDPFDGMGAQSNNTSNANNAQGNGSNANGGSGNGGNNAGGSDDPFEGFDK
jgi:uncharacterized membrane protein YgcG